MNSTLPIAGFFWKSVWQSVCRPFQDHLHWLFASGYLRCPPVPLRSALTALLLAPLVPLHSADDLPEPPVSWKYPPEMPGANVEVYRDVNGIKLNAYIFTPPNHQVSDHRPAVLFFFGGGWKGGTPGQFLPQSLYLARRGMVAIPCDYRVSSRHNAIP